MSLRKYQKENLTPFSRKKHSIILITDKYVYYITHIIIKQPLAFLIIIDNNETRVYFEKILL